MKRLVLLAAALCIGSCSFHREIRVASRGDEVIIDFPWSIWRLAGLQDREYPCIERVELFDRERVLWSLDAAQPDGSCTDARMPITIGKAREGFIAKGAPRMKTGHYGVSIRSYAPARVDFVLRAHGSVQNIADPGEQMEAPCGTYFGTFCPQDSTK